MGEEIRIVLHGVGEEELKGSILITGFQGFGGVGYITTRYIVGKCKAERIGYILTRVLPDITFSDEGKVALPYELYSFTRDGRRYLVLVNHVLPMADRARYAEELILWAKRVGVEEAVLVGGLDVNARTDNSRYRLLANSHYTRRVEGKILESNLYIIGPLALLTVYSEIHRLPVLVVLPYAEPARVDPGAAAVAIEVINRVYDLNIDPSELYMDAEALEREYEKISEIQRIAEGEAKKTTHYM